jgi:signal transduction histidine kinase
VNRKLAKEAGSALALAAVYFAAGKLGLQLAFVHESATAVWPPTGIGLAACLILGSRIWPGIFLGAFLVNVTTDGSLLTSMGIAAGNTLESLLGSFFVDRWAGGRKAFARPADVLRFAFLAGLVATTLSATVGVASLSLGHSASWAKFGSIWLTWWLGDAAGALVVAPLLILWCEPPRIRWSPSTWAEAGIVLGILFGVTQAIFGGGILLARMNYPLAFLTIPVVVWVAVRFEPRETATALAVLSGLALWGTLRGWGPFGGKAPNESLLLLQSFMGVISVMALVLGAAVAERRKAQEELRRAHDNLESRVTERTRSLSEALGALQNEVAQRHRAEEDRSRMMGQLLQGQKLQAVGQLAAGIAHEINNPVGWTLTNLTVVAEHLAELERLLLATDRAVQRIADGGDPSHLAKELRSLKKEISSEALLEDCRDALKDCKGGAERIRDIVRNLREFSHLDEGELKSVDPRVLIESSLQLCSNELKHKATIHREYEEVSPTRCYPQQIEQVLVNLLVNAAHSLPEKGDIYLRTRTENDHALIQIRDTGCGIAPHHKQRLFEPFFTTKPVGKGTGLGLYVAYKIIRAHQGKIEVASEEGRGTEFSILLPLGGPGGKQG